MVPLTKRDSSNLGVEGSNPSISAMFNQKLEIMRAITNDAVNAFMNDQNFSRSNTTVKVERAGFSYHITCMYLFGNLIAQKLRGASNIDIRSGGWMSVTTKERLNGLPGVTIQQKKGVWYLNGELWRNPSDCKFVV